MFCTSCGRELKKQSSFCPYCGATMKGSVSVAEQEPHQKSEENKKNKKAKMSSKKRKLRVTLIIILVWLLVLVAGALLVLPKFGIDPLNLFAPAVTSSEEPVEPANENDDPVPDDPAGTSNTSDAIAVPVGNDSGADSNGPLVSDAFWDDSHKSTSGNGGTYAIPQINLEGADVKNLNDGIYNTLYYGLVEDILNHWNSSTYSGTSVDYQWVQYGDVLSLVIKSHPDKSEGVDYYVYNISVSEQREMTDDEVIEQAGIWSFEETVREAMEAEFWENNDADAISSDKQQVNRFNRQLNKTRSDSNINIAKPYFNSKNQLCAICRIYTMTDEDSKYCEINLEDYNYQSEYSSELQFLDESNETVHSGIQSDDSYPAVTSETRVDRWLYPRPERTLMIGSQGEDVKYIQSMLITMNYDGVVVDGYFSSSTESALMRWQKKHGYAQTGVVDEDTLRNMEAAEVIWLSKQ